MLSMEMSGVVIVSMLALAIVAGVGIVAMSALAIVEVAAVDSILSDCLW